MINKFVLFQHLPGSENLSDKPTKKLKAKAKGRQLKKKKQLTKIIRNWIFFEHQIVWAKMRGFVLWPARVRLHRHYFIRKICIKTHILLIFNCFFPSDRENFRQWQQS